MCRARTNVRRNRIVAVPDCGAVFKDKRACSTSHQIIYAALRRQKEEKMAKNYTMDTIVSLAKSRGFVYPGSEIYGGLANTWDYGNLGVELKNNVKKAWWKKFVQESKYNVGIDCAILMNPQTWIASGHLASFSDPLMDCKECHERFRADKLIEDYAAENGIDIGGSADGWTNEQMESFIEEHQIPCPSCGKHNFTGIRQKRFCDFDGRIAVADSMSFQLKVHTTAGFTFGIVNDMAFLPLLNMSFRIYLDNGGAFVPCVWVIFTFPSQSPPVIMSILDTIPMGGIYAVPIIKTL